MVVHFCSSARRRTALAASAMCLGLSPAWGQFSSSGAVNTYPGNQAIPNGAGAADLGNVGLFVGNSAPGSFSVLGGSLLRLGALSIGPSGNGTGAGTVLLDGAGTRVSLVGDGFSDGVLNRLGVGDWGRGSLTVSGGAVLDGRAEAASCLGEFHYCGNFIGNAAGSDGTLTVTGAGSQASFLRYFGVGNVAVFHPPVDAFTFGTPGGTTRGRVEVLNGGRLTTDGANMGLAPGGGSPTGTERGIAEAVIDGPGSVWRITGGTLEPRGASFQTAVHRNAVTTLTISNGGKLHVDGPDNFASGIDFSNGGGRTDLLVTGTGSQIEFTSDGSYVNVGRRLGSALFTLQAGASVTGANYTSVGRDGSFGELVIDGPGTLYAITSVASGASYGAAQPSNVSMEIGRNGTGVVTVRNGGRLEVLATDATGNSPALTLGRGVASSGTLNIVGSGSAVQLAATSTVPGGGPTEAFNPIMRVGRDGNGELNITGGGKLLIDGQAVSTFADSRGTNLYIGGTNFTDVGGRGIALVSGAGSEIRLTGSDTHVSVGRGPQSFGQLTVADQATVSSLGLSVGNGGGVGVLKVDNASMHLSGQQTGNVLAGAFMVIGNGGGIGVATFTNGSILNLTNMGTAGAGIYLGGTGGTGALGDGSLTVSGGSHISIQAAPGLAQLSVARDGSALMRIKGASTVNVGDGDVHVARFSGSDGTVILSENSVLNAGWIGVGRNKTATGSEDGGTGTFVLVNSTLVAHNIVIGSNGFLGGSGVISGNIENHGIFAPGNSPGTLEINGSFTAEPGSRMILEVESDGQGGFNTDHVIFTSGQTLDLTNFNAEFRFLGNTDPNAFKATGLFDVDNFFRVRQPDNSLQDLAPEVFGTTVFTAQADQYTISSFTFSAAAGASFVAAPVPEPSSWAMLIAGMVTIAAVARRRKSSRVA